MEKVSARVESVLSAARCVKTLSTSSNVNVAVDDSMLPGPNVISATMTFSLSGYSSLHDIGAELEDQRGFHRNVEYRDRLRAAALHGEDAIGVLGHESARTSLAAAEDVMIGARGPGGGPRRRSRLGRLHAGIFRRWHDGRADGGRGAPLDHAEADAGDGGLGVRLALHATRLETDVARASLHEEGFGLGPGRAGRQVAGGREANRVDHRHWRLRVFSDARARAC